MERTPSINPRIVEGLYAEALVLADEVRARFERLRAQDFARIAILDSGRDCPADDVARVQLSCEALRTTTRVMHCLAWLLNHRAHFAGELTELQLRRHGRLVANFPASDAAALALLPAEARMLVHESERLYERIMRLERAWRRPAPPREASAIDRLRQRLAAAS
ncbi:DUF1465 family protein [Novosphingobium percolationis]|uniref:DUF1465 family protein n=1 Tax=Novosphingobium percolationis TaxID=2871811 RepID=UPI001CD6854A|nr:DUF1465 family protein [Novosphingobium percolationis]